MAQLIVQKLCPRSPVQRLNINGEDVKIAAIVDRIETIARILNNRHYPICVLFDRERRAKTCDQIYVEVECELASRGLNPEQFRVGICDRTIENWILADRSLLLNAYNFTGSAAFEGTQGKPTLKRICERVEQYRETTVGVRLFTSANPQVMYDNSPSFQRFVSRIDFQCSWSERIER